MDGQILLLLLLLACPLVMVWMMRGHGAHGHGSHASGHAGHGCGHGGPSAPDDEPSLEELRRRRTELDAEIEGEEQPRAPIAR